MKRKVRETRRKVRETFEWDVERSDSSEDSALQLAGTRLFLDSAKFKEDDVVRVTVTLVERKRKAGTK